MVRDAMRFPDDDAKKTGVTVLVALSLIAGFVVATTATGQDYQTVGTASEDHEAYAVTVEEDQRLRFQLEDAPDHASAAFSVYDPDDRHFASFELAGSEDAEMIADRSGAWVVFVTEAVDAEVAVQVADADENETELRALDVETTERTVATQDGGELDETLKLRLEPRPAVAQLEASGSYEDLDATLTSEEGVVFAMQDASSNSSGEAEVEAVKTAWNPGNLVAGTYDVEAQAPALEGELTVVHKTYDRPAELEETPTEAEAEQVDPDASRLDEASIVAEVQPDQAVQVPTESADEILLATENDTRAEVFVYNASDDMHQVVEIEGDYERDNYEEEDENATAETQYNLQALEAPAERAVVYVDHASGEEETVLLALDGEAPAAEAEELELTTTEVTVEHGENSTASAEIPGALVDVDVRPGQEDASTNREVTVEGPLGVIAEMHSYASAFGGSAWGDHRFNPENLSDGEIVIEVEQDSLVQQGETRAELVHIAR